MGRRGNVQWTPGRLLAAATLMNWDDAQTLRARFRNARDVLGRMFPDWEVPSSYSGFAQALARDVDSLRFRVQSRLQQQSRRVGVSTPTFIETTGNAVTTFPMLSLSSDQPLAGGGWLHAGRGGCEHRTLRI